jgi:hypothetical protein
MQKLKLTLATLCFLCLAAITTVHAQAWGDFTLTSLQNSNTAQLMNNAQQVVKTWTFPTADKTGYSSYLLPGGSIMRAVSRTGNSFTGGPICGKVQTTDWSGATTWDFVYSTTAYCTHHDICPMPNGNVLVIAYEIRSAAQATAAGATNGILMWPDKIVEIKPTGLTTGQVVWEWHIWDHLVQNVDATKANYQTSVLEHPELLNINYKTSKDWIHMNGVDYNPILDQITFSSHNLNEWYVIDHSTTTAEAAGHTGGNAGKGGDFLFRWGGPASYGATGTAILKVTHDAHWIPEGVPNAGRLVGFNNQGVSNSASCVDQAMPPRVDYNYTRTAGAAYAPATYDARHACSGYSSNMGNSQQLPNGNMLVCVATAGKVYEINSAGTTLWSKTFTGSCPQAFDSCYVFNTPPAIPDITESCTMLSAPSATTYQWYMNGNLLTGETNQMLMPTQSGTYVVRITDANGCVYRYSPGHKYIMTVLNAAATATTCGLTNGSATATATGAAPLTYAWSTGATTAAITNIASGDYTVTVTNGLGCTTTATANVAASTATTATAGSINTMCGLTNGSATATATGTAPLTYAWNTGATTATITNIASGNYTVTVTNGAGCTATATANVAASTAVNVTVTTTDTPTGAATGTATANAAGGTSFYVYIWDNGQSAQTATGLTPGNYCVTVTDANNCSTATCVTVAEIVGTTNATTANHFTLYPNPTTGILHLTTTFTNFTVTVSDVLGKTILQNQNTTDIDLGTCANGLYFVTLRSDNAGQVTQRVLLNR